MQVDVISPTVQRWALAIALTVLFSCRSYSEEEMNGLVGLSKDEVVSMIGQPDVIGEHEPPTLDADNHTEQEIVEYDRTVPSYTLFYGPYKVRFNSSDVVIYIDKTP